MTSFNAAPAATTSSLFNNVHTASSSRHPLLHRSPEIEDDLISRSSSPPKSDRKGKGKAMAVEFELESEAITERLEGGLDEDEREFREESDTEGEAEDEENYEAERQRRIRENLQILAGLGIDPSGSGSNIGGGPTSSNIKQNGRSSPQPRSSRKRRNAGDIPILDRSGYIISLPPEGQTHTMACIEIPSDRKLKKRISDGEYTDCSHWMEGEARRWKFGFGKGGDVLPEGEPHVIGGVSKDFRWRRWRGLEKELRSEMKKRGELVEMDSRPVERVIPEGVSAYSLLPGDPCHQCRRKSDKPKMKCRNVNPICRATFCETCCKRKKNLAHLLGASKGKIQRKSIKYAMGAEVGGEMSVQSWLEKAVKDVSRAPFDLIRIVDHDKDIISPDIPPEEQIEETIVVENPQPKKARRKRLSEKIGEQIVVDPSSLERNGEMEKPKAKRGRKKKIVQVDEEEIINTSPVRPSVEKTNKLVVKLKIPKPVPPGTSPAITTPAERVKEVDSDGDTVGDWSDDNVDGGDESSLTSLSSLPSKSPAIPARLPFPPRPIYAPIMDTNEYLSTLPGADQNESIPVASDVDLHSTPLKEETPHTDSSIHNDSGDDLSHSRKRKRPPPAANIVRAPRHSSFSASQSSPIGTHEELEYAAPPPILSVDNGPRNLTSDGDNQLSAVPQFTTEQHRRLDMGLPPLLSSTSTSTSNHQMGYWQSRAMAGYDQTLYPSSLESNRPSISPSSSFLPINYSSTNSKYTTNNYPSLPLDAYRPADFIGNIPIGGPPPYSHSPPSASSRRSLVLSPNSEAQYLRIGNTDGNDRIPQNRTISPGSITLPIPNTKGSPMGLGHLDILSSAAEIRESNQEDHGRR
uniref:Zinc-finger domain-containing protein n=1 Tax=Kwoniella bestiolae CBS 10118 TaxID=1296100 RepID=A0A1B9G9B1_9TREE|nr:hypothetical protein I302_02440 [Kwoniella bestiolae CBS 10118]OCF27597.1 hypothetical protein I302_02440 [Kwoniella bestiolae CBS 10118]